MDMMAIRRRVLMGGKKVIDTTIKILAEDSRWTINGDLATNVGNNASIIYAYEPQSVARQLVYDGLVFQLIIFENGTYKDFWTVRNGGSDTRNVINANSNGIGVTVPTSNINDAYAYLPSNGQILFAGKNTPYYGYTNINDMPTQKGAST